MERERESGVFNRYSKNNKLKIMLITLLIASVVVAGLYFFVKTLYIYTLTFETNGGTVVEPVKLSFGETMKEPENVKKEGYYIERWCKDKELTQTFSFGGPAWSNTTVYVDWQPGFALVLNFVAGEENSDLSLANLKLIYEQYVKSGSSYSLPAVYNNNPSSLNYGERLVWFENEDGSGEPILDKTYIVTENTYLYGKWFDTDESKFEISSNGELTRYLGYCNKIILPSSVRSIKSIERSKFITGNSDNIHDQESQYFSTFRNVLNSLEIIYINDGMIEIGECAFKDVSKLKQIIFIGDTVEVIKAAAFEDCISLVTLKIPSKVTVINENTFRNTAALTTLNTANVERILNSAFINSGIKSITLSKVTFLAQKSFASCHRMIAVIIMSPIVIETDVTVVTGEGNNNIFLDTADGTMKLKIYVSPSLLSAYKTTAPWSTYAGYINEI